ncbi:MAG TPA: hypothetical protein VGI82_14915 [Chitinophagaceae bacterium]
MKITVTNITAYILYLILTYIITVQVGWSFYKNGEIYILQLLQGDRKLTLFINKMLLTGYYLLNLGYAALMLSRWKTIHTPTEIFLSVTTMTGKIMLTLAVIHFMNMTAIFLYSKKYNNHIVHHKN